MQTLRNLAMRVLLVSATLVTIWIVSGALGWTGREAKRSTRAYFKPACDGLSCRNTAECGTRCTCVVSGGSLGMCVARPRSDLPHARSPQDLDTTRLKKERS